MNNNNKRVKVNIDYIISLIFKVDRLIYKQLKKEREHLNPLSILRLETLRYIAEKNGPSMKEVANHFCITPPSATSLIDSLVKSKVIRRVYDKNDRRAIRLFATSKGQKELKRGINRINNNMRKILRQLGTKELKDLARILEKLLKIYERYN